jgi:hypothetical protein
VLQVTFDSAPGTDIATYTPAAGDIPSSVIVTKDFNSANGDAGSPIDYGKMGPSGGPYTDTGNYPDIVDDAAIVAVTGGVGSYAGNAMFTALGDNGGVDPTEHIGWYIEEDNGVSISGDFTAEAMFMLNLLMTDHLEGYGSEYGLQNIFGNMDDLENVSGNAALWKFRVWPQGGALSGNGKIQLDTWSGSAEVTLDGPAPVTTHVWHHVACAYDSTAGTIELFFDGVSYGSISPGWANDNQSEWWIGEWPKNPAPRGMAGWIDAVCISDEVLAPGSFVLPGTDVENWYELY